MKNIFIFIGLTLFFIYSLAGCGKEGGGKKKGTVINGVTGTVKKLVDGNTLLLTSGLKVQLLGVNKDYYETTRALLQNNNIIGKKVKLIAESREKNKKIISFTRTTVKAYVKLQPSGRSLNLMILDQNREAYDEAFMKDSLASWRKRFNGICKHDVNLPDLPLYMKQRTFLVQTDEGIGTGFFINENGLALTNGHVMAPADEKTAKACLYSDDPNDNNLYTQKIRHIKKIHWSQPLDQMDITIFTVDLLPGEKVPYFHLTKERAPIGSNVSTFGNPADRMTHVMYQANYTSGKISNYMLDENHGRPHTAIVTYDIPTNPGNSGGPVALDNGLVIAVHNMGEPTSQGLNSGIDILPVRKILDSLHLPYECK